MNHGSLFSGIGGFEVAAECMGWENMFHCEINPFGRNPCHALNAKQKKVTSISIYTEWAVGVFISQMGRIGAGSIPMVRTSVWVVYLRI